MKMHGLTNPKFKRSLSVLHTKYYSSEKKEKNEIGGACGSYGIY
jgi:hypothetical protein